MRESRAKLEEREAKRSEAKQSVRWHRAFLRILGFARQIWKERVGRRKGK